MASETCEKNQTRIIAIQTFIDILDNMEIETIEISIDKNPRLLPYYNHVMYSYAESMSGIVIMDRQGIYTPVESYDDNVIHVVRLMWHSCPVYALTDLRSIVRVNCNGLVVLFLGVYRTRNGDYDYMSNEFFLRPAPGVSFDLKLLVPHVIPKSQLEEIVQDDGDDDEDWEAIYSM